MRYTTERKQQQKWKTTPTLVSIITVNRNSLKRTYRLIDSILEHVKSVGYEIVVIDSTPHQEEAIDLIRDYPFVRVIHSPECKTDEEGYNIGCEVARSKYLMLLDNHVELRESGINYLIETLDTQTDAGAVSPQIFDIQSDGNSTIARQGHTPIAPYTLRHKRYKATPIELKHRGPKEIPFLYTAAVMVKKKAVGKSGGIPNVYRTDYTELDWSISLRSCGYRLYHDSRYSVLLHKSKTVEDPIEQTRLTTIDTLLFAYRNRGRYRRLLCYLCQLMVVMPFKCVRYVCTGQSELATATRKGIKEYFAMKDNEKLDRHGPRFSYATNQF